jgi:hypothetical protein
MANLTEKACTLGQMEKCTTGSGLKESNMGTVSGRAHRGNHTSASGTTTKRKVMECTLGKMVTAMKASGMATSDTALGMTSFRTETSTAVSTIMENPTGQELTSGKTALFTKESFKMD